MFQLIITMIKIINIVVELPPLPARADALPGSCRVMWEVYCLQDPHHPENTVIFRYYSLGLVRYGGVDG